MRVWSSQITRSHKTVKSLRDCKVPRTDILYDEQTYPDRWHKGVFEFVNRVGRAGSIDWRVYLSLSEKKQGQLCCLELVVDGIRFEFTPLILDGNLRQA